MRTARIVVGPTQAAIRPPPGTQRSNCVNDVLNLQMLLYNGVDVII